MTEKFADQQFRNFVYDLNSSKPSPGGGSAAAFAGAMAGALAGMAAHLTVGKKSYADVEEEMQSVIASSEALQREMLAMAQEDADMFGLILNAYKIPKSTPHEQAKRQAEIERASKIAVLASLHLSETCIDILRLAEKVVGKGSRLLVTDGAASAILARACLRIAAYNVTANLKPVRDKDFVYQCEVRLHACRDLGASLEQDILDAVDSELGK